MKNLITIVLILLGLIVNAQGKDFYFMNFLTKTYYEIAEGVLNTENLSYVQYESFPHLTDDKAIEGEETKFSIFNYKSNRDMTLTYDAMLMTNSYYSAVYRVDVNFQKDSTFYEELITMLDAQMELIRVNTDKSIFYGDNSWKGTFDGENVYIYTYLEKNGSFTVRFLDDRFMESVGNLSHRYPYGGFTWKEKEKKRLYYKAIEDKKNKEIAERSARVTKIKARREVRNK